MRIVVGLIVLLAVTACSSRDEPNQLMNIRNEGRGPDEFAVVPNEPLEIPDNVASAELPTPGGTSRADRGPDEILTEALGGRAGAGVNDQAFVNAVGRFGVAEGIRGVLAQEDVAFRADGFVRPLERAAKVNVYFKFYEEQTLDSYDELNRLRRAGVRTPTAPPAPE
ncbi:MAG: DUF3035 domain-containing protein [Pseudomonadota bacterium]